MLTFGLGVDMHLPICTVLLRIITDQKMSPWMVEQTLPLTSRKGPFLNAKIGIVKITPANFIPFTLGP